MSMKHKIAALALAAAALALPACSHVVDGHAVAAPNAHTVTVPEDQKQSGHTGTLPTAQPVPPPPPVNIQAPAGGVDPQYADLWNTVVYSANTVHAYWRANAAQWGIEIPSVTLVPQNVTDQGYAYCHSSGKNPRPFAWACPSRTTIVIPLPNINDLFSLPYGDIQVALTLGHEMGHIMLPLVNPDANHGGYAEVRADCASGAFIQWLVSTPSANRKGWSDDDAARALLARYDGSFDNATRIDYFAHGLRNGGNSCAAYTPS